MSRGRTIIIALLAVLLVANGIVFFTYRVRQQERINDLKAKRDATEARLLEARTARELRQQQLAGYKQVRTDLDHIYAQTWATPETRLTPLLIEMQRLATRSQLIPTSIAYTRSSGKALEDTETMKISFSVEGSYQDARRLINLIENSTHFVAIDEIGLSSASGEKLQLRLGLKTLFRDTAPRKGATSAGSAAL